MVRARVDAAHSVGTSWQAGRDIGGQDAIRSRGVETLEESEDGGVQGRGRGQRRKRLDGHMAVAYNESVSVDGLRCSIVLGVGIDEGPSSEVVDCHLDCERLIRLQALIEIWREDELGRGLLILGSDTAHRDRATRSIDFLLAVSQGNGLGIAKVDEVVAASQ